MVKYLSGRYVYRVLFWAYPKSGFDLAKKTIVVNMFENILRQLYENDSDVEAKLSSFFDSHNDKATFIEMVESDSIITDPQTEVLPVLLEKYPGAEIAAVVPFNQPI